MNLYLVLTTIALLFSMGKAKIVIETDDPVLPEVVVIRGEGSIVDPDLWTPFPTLPPVETPGPSRYPIALSPPPTEQLYHLWDKGSHNQCIYDTGLTKDVCLEAALLVGKEYNFPYYLNTVDDPNAPCGCHLLFNDDGNPIVSYNTNTLSLGGCAVNARAQLVCFIPPPTMAPSASADCYEVSNTYYAQQYYARTIRRNEGMHLCYKIETGKSSNNAYFWPKWVFENCNTLNWASDKVTHHGSAAFGSKDYTGGVSCGNQGTRSATLNIYEQEGRTSTHSYAFHDQCTFIFTIERPPCLGTYAPVDPTPYPTQEPTKYPTPYPTQEPTIYLTDPAGTTSAAPITGSVLEGI